MTTETAPLSMRVVRMLAIASFVSIGAGFGFIVAILVVLASPVSLELPTSLGFDATSWDCGTFIKLLINAGQTAVGGEQEAGLHDYVSDACRPALVPFGISLAVCVLAAVAFFTVGVLTRRAAFRIAARDDTGAVLQQRQ